MRKIFAKYVSHNEGGALQDVLFLVGIFFFISILIIGLFPGRGIDFVINREYFIYGVMTVPVLAAVYFIIISARRKRSAGSMAIGNSIRKKMALAFMFVALLPSLPLVLTANYFINMTMAHFFEQRDARSAGAARILARVPAETQYRNMERELDSLDFILRKGGDYRYAAGLFGAKKIGTAVLSPGGAVVFEGGGDEGTGALRLLGEFYGSVEFSGDRRIDDLALHGGRFIAGALKRGGMTVVLYERQPDDLAVAALRSVESLFDDGRMESTLMSFKTRAGIFFFLLSIVIIIISVILGLYLSKSITRPVLDLSEAAEKVAAGDFTVAVNRESEDELGVLYSSFGSMVRELDRNRKTMYQKQKLEAWREMARRLVHEIKNPLTPIRLSAERIRKRYLENHPDIKNILIEGTETIIEEVDVLMGILAEFTKFARLPEMKQSEIDLNEIVESCVSVFSGHERIRFVSELATLPVVMADKVLMRQAVLNLIQNAIDSVGEEGTITVKSAHVGSVIKIAVLDDGGGIREEDLDNIFSPGFSTKPQGSGLGLAIVEKIVMEHGGKIYCISKQGRGAEFTIELPVAGRG